MTLLFGWFIRKHWGDLGRSPGLSFVSDGLTAVAMLLVFWFTSKAMGHSFASGYAITDYFSFVVMGETLLYVPGACFSGLIRGLRASASDGTLEPILASRRSPTVTFALVALAWVPQDLARCLIMWLIAVTFFTLRFTPTSLCLSLLTQIAGIPVFLGMGLWGGAMLVRYGRGGNLMAQVNLFASVFAGAYFPIGVFPKWLQNASQWLSPFTLYLETGRSALLADNATAVFLGWAKLLLVGTLLCFSGAGALSRSFEWLRRSGRPLLLSQ